MRYQVSPRTVRFWRMHGEKLGLPVPLHDPRAMLEWWAKVTVRKGPPRGMREAAERAAEVVASEPARTDEPAADPVLLQLDPGVDADMGLLQAQALAKSTYEELAKALAHGRSGEVARLRREWKEAVQTLRQWEKDITRIREGKGEVLRIRQLGAELSAILSNIARSFDAGLDHTIELVAPETAPDTRRSIVREQRDRIFGHLRATRFESAWEAAANGLA